MVRRALRVPLAAAALVAACGGRPATLDIEETGTARPTAADACERDWTVQPLWRGGLTAPEYPLHAPSASRIGGRVILTGNTRRPSDGTPMGDSVVAMGFDGGRVELPRAARGGIHPMLGATGDTLYLVWGEERPRADRGSWMPEVNAVWYAVRVPGSPWSEPRAIARASREIPWNQSHASRLVRTPDGALELLFVAARAPVEGTLVLVRFERAQATVQRRELANIASHVRMARRGDTAYAMYVGADTSQVHDQNSLYFTSWTEGDFTRAPTRLLQLGRTEGAAYPHLVSTRDGALHAVWSQLGAGVLRHTQSRDGGRSWSEPTDLRRPNAYGVEAFAVGDDAVAILFEELDVHVGPMLAIACWGPRWGGWRDARRIANDVSMMGPAMVDTARLAIVATRGRVEDGPKYDNVLVAPPVR